MSDPGAGAAPVPVRFGDILFLGEFAQAMWRAGRRSLDLLGGVGSSEVLGPGTVRGIQREAKRRRVFD